jgi:hypothetical protein
MKPAINARLLWPTLVNLRRKKADPLHQIVANEIFHATLRPIMSGRELNQFSKLNGSLGHFIYEVSFDSVWSTSFFRAAFSAWRLAHPTQLAYEAKIVFDSRSGKRILVVSVSVT